MARPLGAKPLEDIFEQDRLCLLLEAGIVNLKI
jgi:hypothetical protein